jgi:alpha-tubulin suppressor-like RCC1 family protein
MFLCAALGMFLSPCSAAVFMPAISAGENHSLALRSDGSPWAWGYNWFGQLGDNTGTDQRNPVRVINLSNVVSIVAGYRHSAALLNDGTVWTWGDNFFGQIGDGSTDTVRFFPVRVTTLSNITAIACGQYHSLAIDATGAMWAWGANAQGQLGDGTMTNRFIPVRVATNAAAISVAAGGYHSLALLPNGTMLAWGDNSVGQLGDNTSTTSYIPVAPLISNVTAISAGFAHSLALKADSTLSSWGQNLYRALGDGTTIDRAAPVSVLGMSNVIAISCGGDHNLVLKSDATVFSWGRNAYGQLGDGTSDDRSTAARILSLSGITAVSGGYRHSMALSTNGVILTWGANGRGQLGGGNVSFSRLLPAPVNQLNLGTNILLTSGAVLPVASQGAPYSVQLNALGGVPPFQWSVTSGSLPAGISLNPTNGLLSGTPSVIQTTRCEILVTGADQQFTSKSFNLSVQPGLPVIITPSPLPPPVVTFGYFARLEGRFGAAPYTWSVISGTLPNGITLDPASGILAGVPSSIGNFRVRIRLATQNAQLAETDFDIQVLEDNPASAPWGTGNHDNQRAGRSASRGPLQPLVKWSTRVQGMPGSPVVSSNGTIYVPTGMLNRDTTGYLYALRPDGSEIWNTSFSGLPSCTAPALVADGTIYVHMNGGEGNQVALERMEAVTTNGYTKFIFYFNDVVGSYTTPTPSTPAVASDGTIYVGSMDTRLYAINPDGTLKWRRTLSVSSINVSPALPHAENAIYTSDAGSTLGSFNTAGNTNWLRSYDDGGGSTAGQISIAPDGTVYVSDKWNKQLVAFDPNGNEKWRYTLTDYLNCTPALAADGTIYVCADGLYAINPNGSLKWKAGNALFTEASPILSADGLIFWRESFKLYGFTSAGQQKWVAAVPPAVTGATPTPALARDGTLYSPQPDAFTATNQRVVAYFTRPLEVSRVAALSNNVTITWHAIGGEAYRVQSASLPDTNSLPLSFSDVSPSIVVAGTNATLTSFTHTGATATAAARLYRVRRLP